MYSFDGQHKTGLKVSLGGASKKVDKKSLLQSAKDERTKRELIRRQNIAALKIQSWYRGITVRKFISATQRNIFDSLIKNEGGSDSLILLIEKLCYFYKACNDYQRLIVVSQSVLKLNSSKQLQKLLLKDEAGWLLKLKKLLFICCRSLEIPNINLAIPLRMLEVFTESTPYICFGQQKAENTSSSIILFLVQKGYFRYLCKLINARVPSSLEPCINPPTPFSGAARDLVLKAVKLNSICSDDTVTESKFIILYSALIEDLLSPAMTPQICYFLIPSMSASFQINHLFLKAIANTRSSHSIWTLYAYLTFCEHQLDKLNIKDVSCFLGSLKLMIKYICHKKEVYFKDEHHSDSSDDNEDMETATTSFISSEPSCFNYALDRCIEIINEKHVVSPLLHALEDRYVAGNVVDDLCYIAFHMLFKLRISVHKSRFLNNLAFCKQFLRLCWKQLLRPVSSVTRKQIQLVFHLSLNSSIAHVKESMRLLTVFSALFKYALFSIYDFDFYSTSADAVLSLMPFTLAEVVEMSTIVRDSILGLIMLMYPESKTVDKKFFSKCVFSCQMATAFVKQLYARDCRHRFCPENHWLSDRAAISQENLNVSTFLEEQETEEKKVLKPGMSLLNLRNLAVLKYIPFAVPFLQRVRIFQRILSEDKKENQNVYQNVLPSHSINITVNRKYLYQDAYDQLSQDRADDIKKVIRIHMINAQGLDEAGIDGGGVFREFMSQLLRSGFDPSIGFFKTTSQQLLYPNPDIGLIHPDYLKHLHFLGRMLGKVIYESMMVELPLADFFLCKLLNKAGSDVDIHHLESLDPELYRNLLYLKNYKEDVEDLSLNFTVANNEYGETKILELKPGGKDISVTNSNKIEYIHLMADYRLNKQIRTHCSAFRSGLADVINIEWLQMFDQRELQVLISGAQVPIDMEDLRRNTSYSGSFTPEDPYIEEFWKILEELTDHQKRLFLKFVTSCSRPPLLGFTELYPRFCVHGGGEEDRLPTASTCMNFLKLPIYKNSELLKTRLIYAIEAEAGFELS